MVSEQNSKRAKEDAARSHESKTLEIPHHFIYFIRVSESKPDVTQGVVEDTLLLDGRSYEEFMAMLNLPPFIIWP